MIKINLISQRKAKRTSEPGQLDVLVGVGALAAGGVALFFLVHAPAKADLDKYTAANEKLSADNEDLRKEVKKGEELKAALDDAEKRNAAIERLVTAKSVPAHLLQELGDILTPGRLPTMTKDMALTVGDGPMGKANRRFALDWDPRHVWITALTDKTGSFTLEGGAQSDADVTQLAKRMQASVYFEDVTPTGGRQATEKDTGVTYYKFTITGKVVY